MKNAALIRIAAVTVLLLLVPLDLRSVEDGVVAGDTITYLSVATDIEPSAEVCAEFESIKTSGLAVIVLTEITVDLESGEVNEPGVFTCRGAM